MASSICVQKYKFLPGCIMHLYVVFTRLYICFYCSPLPRCVQPACPTMRRQAAHCTMRRQAAHCTMRRQTAHCTMRRQTAHCTMLRQTAHCTMLRQTAHCTMRRHFASTFARQLSRLGDTTASWSRLGIKAFLITRCLQYQPIQIVLLLKLLLSGRQMCSSSSGCCS